MKKLLAVFLAAVMMLTIVPFSASAKVESDDMILNELMSGNFHHLSYVKEKNYFKSQLGWYTLFGLYDDAWRNFFTGDVDQANAQAVLLALIDRMEEEYNNETYEKILAILGTAKTGAQLLEKVGSLSGLFDLANNSAWSKSLGVVGPILEGLNLGNDIYEQFVQGYAVILSCQAASIYYGDFLDYLANNCSDKDIKAAAKDLNNKLSKSLEDAVNELIKQLTEDAGKGGAEIAINIALSAFSVTAIAKTVFGVVGSLGDMIFNTKEQFLYMSSLALLAEIEETAPGYVAQELKGNDELSADFAVNALLTLHETGEDMLSNLSKVKEDNQDALLGLGKLFSGSADESAMIRECSIEKAKLNVYRMVLNAEDTYKTYDVFTSTDTTKKAVVYNSDGEALVTLPANAEKSIIDETGAYVTVYDSTISTYIKVMVTFSEGCDVVYKKPTTSSSSSSSSSGGIGGFFAAFFQAFADLFRALFSFGKK